MLTPRLLIQLIPLLAFEVLSEITGNGKSQHPLKGHISAVTSVTSTESKVSTTVIYIIKREWLRIENGLRRARMLQLKWYLYYLSALIS